MKSLSIHAGILCIALVATDARPDDMRLAAKPSASASSGAATVIRIYRNEAPAPVATLPRPPLDVAALKIRLQDTRAIGVFAKLALRNQLDDLLQQFRWHHLGVHISSVASLRQAYELLIFKVLALVRDGDPALARTISESREAIWAILTDPEQFESIS